MTCLVRRCALVWIDQALNASDSGPSCVGEEF